MPNQNALTKRAAGLFNNINNFETPPGSLTVADNVKIDKPNLIEKRPGFDSCSTGLPAGLPLQMFTAQNKLFVHSGSRIYAKDDNCTYSEISGAIGNVIAPLGLQISGSTLYVMENPFGTTLYNLRAINLNTKNILTIRSGINIPDYVKSFTVDGNYLYYMRYYVSGSTYMELHVIDLATGTDSFIAGGPFGYVDGTGAAAAFGVASTTGITSDTLNIYFMDLSGLRKIVKSTGVVTTVVGGPVTGFVDGTGAAAKLRCVGNVKDGNSIYTMQYEIGLDSFYGSLRKIDLTTSSISTIGAPSKAPFPFTTLAYVAAEFPMDFGIDGNYVYTLTSYGGNFYPSSPGFYQALRINRVSGVFERIVGPAGANPLGYIDGSPDDVRFSCGYELMSTGCQRVACSYQKLFIPDYNNSAIRLVDLATNTTTTLIGGSATPASTDGSFPPITIDGPT